MEIGISDIVESLNGRDKGKPFFIVKVTGEFLYLADGKNRKLERPKLKKIKHVRFLATSNSRVADKLKRGEKMPNSEIRKALAEFTAGTEARRL